jgi:ectoine hydroxylase-related dioxygenase (phytanoyl-CoA dioxygenase family)
MPQALAEILAEVEANGFCVVPGMLDADRLRRVRKAFDHAIDVMRQRGLCVFDPRLDPTPHNIRVNNLPDMDPVFMELLRDPAALDIVHAVLGETAIVSNFSANVALPGSGSMNVHADQALIAPAPWNETWLLNIIWCLDDVREENGATLYLPGSHRITRRDEVPADPIARMVPFNAPAGSFIVMEGRLWHTSGVNVTADERRALLFALYSRDFLRQQMNWEALLSDATKQRLDDDDRALLGMGPLGNVHGVDLVMREGYDLASVEVL